jgi:hypothetical protein
MPLPLYPRGESPRYPLYRRLGGPQSRSGRHGEVKILVPPGLELRLLRLPTRSQSLYRLSYPASTRNPVHLHLPVSDECSYNLRKHLYWDLLVYLHAKIVRRHNYMLTSPWVVGDPHYSRSRFRRVLRPTVWYHYCCHYTHTHIYIYIHTHTHIFTLYPPFSSLTLMTAGEIEPGTLCILILYVNHHDILVVSIQDQNWPPKWWVYKIISSDQTVLDPTLTPDTNCKSKNIHTHMYL